MTEHFWGPEQTWNFYCGYDSYADFGKKVDALSKIHEEELADLKLDILEHSDHLMQRVERQEVFLELKKRAFSPLFFVSILR